MSQDKSIYSKKQELTNEGEIDLLQLIKTLWEDRNIIIISTIIFIFFGLLIVLLFPKQFTASTTMVPQLNEDQSQLGELSSIAAMAGFNMNLTSSGEISPRIYPQIINSIPLGKELMNTPIYLKKANGTISVYDYYNSIYKHNLINNVKKYTIDLPGLIINKLKGPMEISTIYTNELILLTLEEKHVLEFLSNHIELKVNEKDGYITLSATMPEALAAAQLTKSAQDLLQRYITIFKIEKAREELEFIQERYNEKKKEFELAQTNLAKFRDQNKNVSTSLARTKEEQLQSEFQLAYTVYSELAKQLEKSKIKVKEDTPVFTVIEPVVIPIEKSKPRRSYILVICTILGGFTGTMMVFGKIIIISVRKNWN